MLHITHNKKSLCTRRQRRFLWWDPWHLCANTEGPPPSLQAPTPGRGSWSGDPHLPHGHLWGRPSSIADAVWHAGYLSELRKVSFEETQTHSQVKLGLCSLGSFLFLWQRWRQRIKMDLEVWAVTSWDSFQHCTKKQAFPNYWGEHRFGLKKKLVYPKAACVPTACCPPDKLELVQTTFTQTRKKAPYFSFYKSRANWRNCWRTLNYTS